MSKSNKLIYDPLHGYMNFNTTCLKIIDTDIFKRLQNIKQIGTCYYVFPGASHNRFEHSLGVSYLAEKMIKNISYQQPELGITERDIELVKIAGLCHDLGHGPYSHAFDNEILPKLTGNDDIIPHEERSGILLKQIIAEQELSFTEEEILFIQECIHPDQKKVLECEKPYLYEIVANPFHGIDVDKFDYLRRDPYNIGLDYHFNCERLLEEARVIEGHICYPKKLANNILNMFSVRYTFLREICNHPVVKSIEYMITDAIIGAESQLQLKTCLEDGRFAKITDEIMYLIEISSQPELENARNILSRIKQRQLYGYVGELQVPANITSNLVKNGLKQSLLDKYGLEKSDIIIQHLKLSYSNTGAYPLETVLFYDYADLDKSFSIYKKDLPMLMPSCFSEKNTIRIYSRNKLEEAQQLYADLKKQYKR